LKIKKGMKRGKGKLFLYATIEDEGDASSTN